jgi:hypothetical protein
VLDWRVVPGLFLGFDPPHSGIEVKGRGPRSGTRRAIDAVRGKQSMTEFCREAIAREIQRRLTVRKQRKE